MKPSGAHTHPDSGSGIGTAALVVLAAVIVAAIAGPVVRAVTDLFEALVVGVAAIAALAVAAVVVAVVIRLRRGPSPAVAVRARLSAEALPPADRAVRPVTVASDRAVTGQIEGPAAHHVHIHLSGEPESDAAVIRALTERARP
jgi:hypothetical protein